MSKSELLSRVRASLLRQGRPSVDAGGLPMYAASPSVRSAVGTLIPFSLAQRADREGWEPWHPEIQTAVFGGESKDNAWFLSALEEISETAPAEAREASVRQSSALLLALIGDVPGRELEALQ